MAFVLNLQSGFVSTARSDVTPFGPVRTLRRAASRAARGPAVDLAMLQSDHTDVLSYDPGIRPAPGGSVGLRTPDRPASSRFGELRIVVRQR